MDDTYAEIGVEVILGRHKRITSLDLCWNPFMERYIGKQATIKYVGRLEDGCLVCNMEGDGGFCWRVEDMILASDVPLLTPQQKKELRILEHG